MSGLRTSSPGGLTECSATIAILPQGGTGTTAAGRWRNEMESDVADIRGAVELPRRVESVELVTDDGVTLVGELALPPDGEPYATLVTFHPLPTHGGFMDSHVYLKAALRLPALAQFAVLRFNTRGTTSPRGTSGGAFDGGVAERWDVDAAFRFVSDRALPRPWAVGWSFGTELVLKYGLQHPLAGAILLSPPLHRATPDEVAAWHGSGVPLTIVVPELDDFLPPSPARERFSSVPEARFVAVDGARHLWVGEKSVYRVLTEIVSDVNPSALPLPTHWPAAT